jgi:hypothetical protein
VPAVPADLVADLVIATPVRQSNLTIFPVVSKSTRADDRFITLDEGLKAGTVEIREVGARDSATALNQTPAQVAANPPGDEQAARDDKSHEAGDSHETNESLPAEDVALDIAANDVNRLVVINRSGKPLYLMPGEVIVGGSQDRTIGEELVVAPTGEPVPIDVFCVEQGRWGTRYATTLSLVINEVADEAADAEELASEANQGKFIGKAGNLGKSGRVAVQAGEGQQKVWDEVARSNGASGVNWSTAAFTANYVDSEVLERLMPYREAMSLAVSKQERVVGVVVAINGKIETVDVFESTPLFLKLWPQLLKSYALDASQVADAEDARNSNSPSEAEAFLASVLRDQESAARKTCGGLVVSRHETNDRISFSAGAMGGMGMMGGSAAPVHSSGFSK